MIFTGRTYPAPQATDVVQKLVSGVTYAATLAIVFDFVPSVIVVDFVALVLHDTTYESGHTTGRSVVTVTGTDTITISTYYAGIRDVNGTWTPFQATALDTTNVVYARGGNDGSDDARITATGAWSTSGRSLTLTYGTLNVNNPNCVLALVATAHK